MELIEFLLDFYLGFIPKNINLYKNLQSSYNNIRTIYKILRVEYILAFQFHFVSHRDIPDITQK